jgi:molecular chaperone GrpE
MSEIERNENLPEDVMETGAGENVTEAEEEITNELEKLREENARLFARLQRAHADFDNYRKRIRAERQERHAQAVSDLARELLPVVDNLERALQAGGTAETLLSGVDMIHKQLLSVLCKQGVSVIEACGREFDPNCHHAVLQVECDAEENTVVEELQKGYLINDRVLRPSMVKVAK